METEYLWRREDALLRVTDVAEGDFAIYKVTVTESNGYQQDNSIEVRKIGTYILDLSFKCSFVGLLNVNWIHLNHANVVLRLTCAPDLF